MPRKLKCCQCKETAEQGIIDSMGRFWCEECAMFTLGDIQFRGDKGKDRDF